MGFKEIYQKISESIDKFDHRNEQWIPYVYASLGIFFMACSSLVCKYFKDFPVFELIYFRSIFIVIFNVKLLEATGDSPYCDDGIALKYLILRSFFSSCSSLMFFTASTMINLGEATILFQTSPIWSNFVSCLFFGEGFCLSTFIYTCISFVGIVIILQPPFIFEKESTTFDSNTFFGQTISILGAITFAIMSNINKFLKGKVSKPQLILYIHIGGFLLSSLLKTQLGYASSQIYSLKYFLVIILLAFFAYTSQIFLNQALFMKGANKIMPFNYTQVIFALIFDYFLFNKTLNFVQYLAGGVIIFCCLKIASKN